MLMQRIVHHLHMAAQELGNPEFRIALLAHSDLSVVGLWACHGLATFVSAARVDCPLSVSDRAVGVETPLSCVSPAERNIRSILCGYRVRLVEALTRDTGHHLVAKSTLIFACQCYLRPISHVVAAQHCEVCGIMTESVVFTS
jgi:hypothetical protein